MVGNTLFMPFDDEVLAISEKGIITCENKHAVASAHRIVDFMQDESRNKKRIGYREDTMEALYIWEDEAHIHVGCLKEEKHSFQEKFVELIKHLNQ